VFAAVHLISFKGMVENLPQETRKKEELEALTKTRSDEKIKIR